MALFPDPPPKLPDYSARDALSYARNIAAEELERVDRMHKRTMNYLSVVLGLFVLAGSVIGYFGWKNLRDAAVAAATAKVKEEVDLQVIKQLQVRNIDRVVDGVVASKAEAAINRQVRAEIAADVDVAVAQQIVPLVYRAVAERRPMILAQTQAALQGKPPAPTLHDQMGEVAQRPIESYEGNPYPGAKSFRDQLAGTMELLQWPNSNRSTALPFRIKVLSDAQVEDISAAEWVEGEFYAVGFQISKARKATLDTKPRGITLRKPIFNQPYDDLVVRQEIDMIRRAFRMKHIEITVLDGGGDDWEWVLEIRQPVPH